MAWKLKYGQAATLELELDAFNQVEDCTSPHGNPIDDPSAGVAAAMSVPLEFPPLSRAMVPGDRVAIALDQGIPCEVDVVAGVVQSVLSSGQELSPVQIVCAAGNADRAARLREDLPPLLRDRVEVSVHDPSDSNQLSYLAAAEDGRPIYFNRILFDADVVLPVSAMRLQGTLGFLGVHGGLFPSFSDEETQQRFRAPSSSDWEVHQRRRREEVEEAAWLMGVQFSIQIIPGPGESVLEVVAGETHAVADESHRRGEAAWAHRGQERAELVIASIEGGPSQQTWDSFARALFAASQAVTSGGAILICSEMRCSPGPALQRLSATDDEERLLHEIRRDRSFDAMSATLLARTKQHARVYLLSHLDREVVEDLGIGYVDSAADAERLGRPFSSCLLLGNAQYARFDLAAEVNV